MFFKRNHIVKYIFFHKTYSVVVLPVYISIIQPIPTDRQEEKDPDSKTYIRIKGGQFKKIGHERKNEI